MAYDSSKETQVDVILIKKNNRGDYIRVSRIEPEDKKKLPSIDIRNMYTTDDDEVRPTQKGVRINSEIVPEVFLAMLRAMRYEEVASIREETERLMQEKLDA